MTHELALLAALFKPHMHCVWRSRGKAFVFSSDNAPTPGGTLLYQRNFGGGFEEIIVYAYDTVRHRYVRKQLSNDGSVDSASSPGPARGVWTFTDLPTAGKKAGAISWKRSGEIARYSYEGVAGTGECR